MLYAAPFVIFYEKRSDSPFQFQGESSLALTNPEIKIRMIQENLGEYTKYHKIPHQSELLRFYEDYLQAKYSSNKKIEVPIPPSSIRILNHRLFVVQYDSDLLHAIDGLKGEDSVNLVVVPVTNRASGVT